MGDITIRGIDLFIIIAYVIAIPVFGLYFKRFIKTEEDFFLAGRMLPFWVISCSIIGTNIGATDYVGAAGGAYRFGLTQANYEWFGAIPAIVLSALLFVPYYWKSGVYTVPEFLGRRYNNIIRVIQTFLWGIFLVFMMGQYFWASGLMLNEYLGFPIMLAILLTAVIVGIYTVSGGLTAVVMTDVVQLLVMFIGGITLTTLGLWTLGGWSGLAETVLPNHPHHLKLFLPANHPTYPWPAVVLGLGLVASPAWWCCNQAMIQRTLGAKSEWDAKAGMLFAGFPKMLVPILTVIPGIIALALNPNLSGPDMDKAYPWLIKNLLPAGLAGLVFTSFIAALVSSVDSVLNSASTLWTRDLYQAYIKKDGTDKHYLNVGRILTALFVVVGVVIAPVMTKFPGLFVAGATVLALFQGPTFAITLLGIYWKRANRWGGLIGMLCGLAISTMLAFGEKIPFIGQDIAFLYYAWWAFVGTLAITVVVSLLTEAEPIEKLEGLVYGLTVQDISVQENVAKRAKGDKEDE